MSVRPEIIGMIGLVVGAISALGLWLRQLLPLSTTGQACPHCGTLQPLPSRPTVLARQVFGRDTCVGCGQKLERPAS
ncbi:MAG: hypothetical protein EOP19_03750 [Hyphomicrobiales bacterium]|nr:MAG: hypothetical protein EOP19_03750 [Hyphomicrobiales bacterium]